MKPEGLPDYTVPAPLSIPAGDDPFVALVPPSDPIPDDNIMVADIPIDIDDDDDKEVEEDVEIEHDNEEDRSVTHNLVGAKIKIFYDDLGQWFEGEVKWFNTKMCKLRVHFEEDDSEDYLKESEINGIDIILCI